MNSKYTVDYANIGLMIVSCIAAFIIPFELFLFSYAVLGPLHYLTEIGWLHQRGYFTKGKYDFVLLAVLGVLITLGSLDLIPAIHKSLSGISLKFIYLAFLAALAMVLVKDTYIKAVLIILVFFSFLFVSGKEQTGFFYLFFAIFLPTIVHVFLFTGAFMLFGAMKSRSIPGYISIVVLIACAVSLFVIQPQGLIYEVSSTVKGAWQQGFHTLNFEMQRLLNPEAVKGINEGYVIVDKHYENTPDYLGAIFNTQYGFVIARFIAFAYTYHYLNWFSKTNVIKWHKVPKKYLIGTVAIWLIAVGLYIKDYGTGLKALFFLSFLHVLLEFPLNFQSFIGIGKEAKNIFNKRKTTQA